MVLCLQQDGWCLLQDGGGELGKGVINRDYYQSVFGYRQYHVLGIKIVLCEPLASIIHYFLFPIHDTADTQRHEGNNLFII